MQMYDKVILLLTGLIAIYMIGALIKRQKDTETAHISNVYFIVSFAVLLVAGLLLIAFGWGALANNFVAVVAGLIPFALATGLVAKLMPELEKKYLSLMAIGLILITISRYGDMSWGKIVYPLFHATAGLTIFILPLNAVRNGVKEKGFALITLGGTLIGLGGIALAFLKAGKQLLFFSQDFVLLILAPLLFLTALCFALGIIKESK